MCKNSLVSYLMILGLFLPVDSLLRAEALPQVNPAEVGFNEERLRGLELLVREGIDAGKMPGCVICIGRHGKIAYLNAFGNKQVQPEVMPMTVDTVFDMASITKPVATSTSVMKLIEQGKLSLGTKVVDIFPEFAPNGKDAITVYHLLIHQSGLIPDNALSDYDEGPEIAWQKICELGLVAEVGTTFKYSDVNFIVLAEIVRKLSGLNVHEFSQSQIFEPLGMQETGYVPREALQARAATTEQREGRWMRGEVHDPRAYALGGIAGHAGLFSTANDLAIYAQMMLGRGALTTADESDITILSPRTVDVMTSGYPISNGLRGLGWDKRSRYSSNRGDLLSEAAFGHGGFTGTVLWIDPDLDLFFIFLSNRVHPSGSGNVNQLAGQVLNVAVSSLDETQHKALPSPPVLAGVDMLELNGFSQLSSQRVGLITNHTGRTRSGKSTVELLSSSKSVDLRVLFSPEHGFEGKLDEAEIANAEDQQTGLKIFSLYGATRKPTDEMMQEIDTFVFDIQDIGARFYTYISTMGEAMKAAAGAKKRFVVLDRPNPINGNDVAGPMLDVGSESFVGFHHLPVRHGMTIGEIALMLKAELELDLELTVIPCQGWERSMFWEDTNLIWVNPSPNMRSLTQALLYPGVGLLETTNVSVGRGTDTPFEVLGAPWIDSKEFAQELNAKQLPGVIFIPIEFTPVASKFENETCGGVNIAIIDRSTFEPLAVGIELACGLRKLYQDHWDTESFNRLLSNQDVLEAVIANKSGNEVLEISKKGLTDFKLRREKFLLYR